jgi:hypothetical protein
MPCRTLKEAEPGAPRLLTELLPKAPRGPRDFKARLAPPDRRVANGAYNFPQQLLSLLFGPRIWPVSARDCET